MPYSVVSQQDEITLAKEMGYYTLVQDTHNGPQVIRIHMLNVHGFIQAVEAAFRNEEHQQFIAETTIE